MFKEERTLELWMARQDRFELALTFPICTWSGTLGPKLREGDRQSPEGFYFATRSQLKPDSAYYRAIKVGFPNAFDRQLGRTGSFLMIHGNCVSIGCYAMTDAGIDDIYTAVEQAPAHGQPAVPIHIFPFWLTPEHLQKHQGDQWIDFWQNLADGDRLFIERGEPPAVAACGDRYACTTRGETFDSSCTRVTGWQSAAAAGNH